MKSLDNTPIACSLTTAELRDREAKLLAQFRSAVIEIEDLQRGLCISVSRRWRVDWTRSGIDCR